MIRILKKSVVASLLISSILLTGCQSNSVTELTITALNIGKADAFILETSSSVVIIDTGTDDDSETILDYLEENNIEEIDALIISHFDKDHVGGADKILTAVNVKAVYSGYVSKESEEVDEFLTALDDLEIDITIISEQTTLTIDGITYELYPAESSSYDEDTSNNSSLVVRVANENNSMLFCGDALEERIEELLNIQGLNSDVIKIPHHGSKIDNLAELIIHVNPTYAIITSSNDSLEANKTIDILNQANVKTYLTRQGDITIIFDENGITINQDTD